MTIIRLTIGKIKNVNSWLISSTCVNKNPRWKGSSIDLNKLLQLSDEYNSEHPTITI